MYCQKQKLKTFLTTFCSICMAFICVIFRFFYATTIYISKIERQHLKLIDTNCVHNATDSSKLYQSTFVLYVLCFFIYRKDDNDKTYKKSKLLCHLVYYLVGSNISHKKSYCNYKGITIQME